QGPAATVGAGSEAVSVQVEKAAPVVPKTAAPTASSVVAHSETVVPAPGAPLMADEADCGPDHEPYHDPPRPNVGPCRRSWYGEAEFLYWFTKRGTLPPLLTTGPKEGFGVLGANGTQTLLDNLRFDRS